MTCCWGNYFCYDYIQMAFTTAYTRAYAYAVICWPGGFRAQILYSTQTLHFLISLQRTHPDFPEKVWGGSSRKNTKNCAFLLCRGGAAGTIGSEWLMAGRPACIFHGASQSRGTCMPLPGKCVARYPSSDPRSWKLQVAAAPPHSSGSC